MKPIAHISKQIIDILNLNLPPNTPVYIGASNIEHIKNRHPYEFDKYYQDISRIINNPDYVGLNPKDNSILMVKLFQIDNEYIRVAVKVTSKNICYAKTLHLLSSCNAERYLEKGTLKNLTPNQIKV